MSIDLPGFADPVLEAQSCFRAVLDAMARPGTLHPAGSDLLPPAPLDPATAAVLLTLIDGETSLFLSPPFLPASDWIGFHCGVVPVATMAAAAFVLADFPSLPDLAALNAGSDESPDASATLILQVPALGSGRRFRLSGPGLRSPAGFEVAGFEVAGFEVGGLPDDFPARWQANHALYPRGVDVILCSGGMLAALPRSVRVEG